MTPLQQTGIPLYHQLMEIFSERLASGEWAPGMLIPTELELCAQYGVSRGPVRQALERLVQEGRLSRKQGKGTTVLPPKIESNLGGLYSFTHLIEQKGLRHTAQTLAFTTTTAAGSVARRLALTPGAPVFEIRRLRLADGEPLILETIHLPAAVCPGLTTADLAAASLYTLLTQRYGLTLARAKQYFEPALADEYEAAHLQLKPGAPVLLLHNLTLTPADMPVVLSRAILRGDRVRYLVELTLPLPVP